MGLRELKETAHQQYVRGKFAQCAKTYQQVLQLAPRDPNMRVRHAEACRRAGEHMQAIASYRVAANLLLELGCETRARGALKAALELDPNDPVLREDVARLEPQAYEEYSAAGAEERGELPLLPPLDSGMDAVPPPASAMHSMRSATPRQTALPPIHRALPAAPSVPPLVPPVLLPAPGVSSSAPGPRTLPPISRTRPATAAPCQAVAPVLRACSATPGALPQAARAVGALTPRSGMAGLAPPVLHPVGTAAPAPHSVMADLQPPVLQPARTLTPAQGSVTSGLQTPPPLPRRSVTGGAQAPASPTAAPSPRATSQVSEKVLVPPPPPAEAFREGAHGELSATPRRPVPTPGAGPRLEVRRLSPNVLAFRDSPHDSWALIRSRTPLEMHLVEDLESLPPELGDFTLDAIEEPMGESASSAMH